MCYETIVQILQDVIDMLKGIEVELERSRNIPILRNVSTSFKIKAEGGH